MLMGDVKGTGGQLRHGLGVSQTPLAGAGVGVAAVDDQGLTEAPAHPLPGGEDGCGLNPVFGKEAGHLRRHR